MVRSAQNQIPLKGAGRLADPVLILYSLIHIVRRVVTRHNYSHDRRYFHFFLLKEAFDRILFQPTC
jgi:hypothetical protein